jgi:predicted nucleic acid-binding protein
VYTIDASTWVNAFDQREPGHEDSRQLLELLADRAIPIVVPNLVLIEVAGAISRTRQEPVQAEAFAAALAQLPTVTLVTLDEALTRSAVALAAQQSLRGADAVYGAVALQSGCTTGDARP